MKDMQETDTNYANRMYWHWGDAEIDLFLMFLSKNTLRKEAPRNEKKKQLDKMQSIFIEC